jgi:hypothetical protein
VKSPVYTLSAAGYARAAAAAIIGGLAMGTVWVLVLVPFQVGILSIFLGAVLGWVFTRVLDFATGRKRGPVVVAFAVSGIGLAWAMQLLVVDLRFALYGLVAVGVGVYMAYQNLR